MVWLAKRTSWAKFAQPAPVCGDSAADLGDADMVSRTENLRSLNPLRYAICDHCVPLIRHASPPQHRLIA